MFYLIKTPFWLKSLYPSLTWNMPGKEKVLYLSFDDGPHATATPFILDTLQQYQAKATFFCIGKNVLEQPELYRRIIEQGHAIGNHTQNHLNGWKTDDQVYLNNIFEAAKYIDTRLFRPPYGRITKFQARLLQNKKESEKIGHKPYKIIMWDVLSGDFDPKISPERCLQNVLLNAVPGSIIVFHDSTKAWNNMQYALPKVLAHFTKEGYSFRPINPL